MLWEGRVWEEPCGGPPPTSLIEQILGDVRDPRRLLPYFATGTAPAALISWLAAEDVA